MCHVLDVNGLPDANQAYNIPITFSIPLMKPSSAMNTYKNNWNNNNRMDSNNYNYDSYNQYNQSGILSSSSRHDRSVYSLWEHLIDVCMGNNFPMQAQYHHQDYNRNNTGINNSSQTLVTTSREGAYTYAHSLRNTIPPPVMYAQQDKQQQTSMTIKTPYG